MISPFPNIGVGRIFFAMFQFFLLSESEIWPIYFEYSCCVCFNNYFLTDWLNWDRLVRKCHAARHRSAFLVSSSSFRDQWPATSGSSFEIPLRFNSWLQKHLRLQQVPSHFHWNELLCFFLSLSRISRRTPIEQQMSSKLLAFLRCKCLILLPTFWDR